MSLGRSLLAGVAILTLIVVVAALLMQGGAAPAPPLPVAPPAPAPAAPPDARPPRRQPVRPSAPPVVPEDEGPEATGVSELLIRVLAAESGEALPGAEVVVVTESGDGPVLRSDERGEVRIDGAPDGATIRAEAAGRVRAEERVVAAAGELTSVELRLVRGVALTGTVVDDRTGEALRGAAVVVTRGGSRDNSFEMSFEPPFGRALTDDLGRFRIDGIEPGGLVTVNAKAERHAEAGLSLVLELDPAEPRSVELRLPPAATLRGSVRYADGRPAAGARVYAVPADAPPLLLADPDSVTMSDGRTIRALRATADDAGEFEIEGLDFDALYSALAVVESFGRSAVEGGVSPTESDPEPRVDLIVRPGPTLTVRVTDPDGEPRSDASLLIFGNGFPAELEPREAGEYFADVPEPGAYTLRITCPNRVVQELAVEILAGEQKELDVRLEAGLVLAGVLVDDRGEPIAGQEIWVDRHWQQAGKLPPSSGRTETDDEGRFRIEGLRDGPHAVGLVLSAHVAPEDLRLEPPNEDLRVIVLRNGAIRARLALPPGAAEPSEVGVRVARRMDGSWGESGHTIGWNEGVLEVANIAPGPCRVRIQVAGASEVVREVTVKPGETLDLGRIALERGLDLAGRVVDRAGRPVAGAEVAAGQIWTPSRRSTTTDREGRFTLGGFTTGENDLDVSAEGYLPGGRTVVFPLVVVPFEVVLDAGCAISVRVSAADGRPAPGARVRLTPLVDGQADEADAEVEETDHRGLLALRLRDGSWRVELLDDEWEPLLGRDVELTEGGALEVDLILPR